VSVTKIATVPTGSPVWRPTLHQAGVWAVHKADIQVTQDGVTVAAPGFGVTHTPSGRCAWCSADYGDAVVIADALGGAYPVWASGAPWGIYGATFWSTLAPSVADVGDFIRQTYGSLLIDRLLASCKSVVSL
jgi:hypothetical protein